MLTQEQFLSHLEPVVFTLVVWSILFVIQVCCASQINALRRQHPPVRGVEYYVGFCMRLLESYTSSGANDSYLRVANPATESFGDITDVEVDKMVPFHPLTTFDQSTDVQEDSDLLALPTEILDNIVAYAFAEYEDLSDPYPFDTCYRRPHHYAPRRTSTSLLRTCQVIYRTYWYLPWTLATHTFYLTEGSRRPKKTTSVKSMAQTSTLIERLHPEAPLRRKQVGNIQVIAQLYMLEAALELNQILTIPFFHPRNITITIRHTDWWYWEMDEPIGFIRTEFVRDWRFPESTQCLTIQLESAKRRKPQVDWMAKHISRNWHFSRTDDVHLVANPKEALQDPEPWKGCATWQGARWLRDEDDAEPNVLSYYLLNVTFRAVRQEDDPDGYQRRKSRVFGGALCCGSAAVEMTAPYPDEYESVSPSEMERLGIPADLSASETVRRLNAIYSGGVVLGSNGQVVE